LARDLPTARPARPPLTKLLGRTWLPILIAVAVAVGVATVGQLREIFGANAVLVTPRGSDTAESFNPKVVTYEVFGAGSTAVINYLDLDSKPQRAVNAPLPWSLTLRTTAPAATPNILAQVDGQTVTCRITVNNEVKDERTVTGANAETFCLVKSA
ncbi:transport accessory protein MmpS, partial [Mycobacterium ahvazicum]